MSGIHSVVKVTVRLDQLTDDTILVTVRSLVILSYGTMVFVTITSPALGLMSFILPRLFTRKLVKGRRSHRSKFLYERSQLLKNRQTVQ